MGPLPGNRQPTLVESIHVICGFRKPGVLANVATKLAKARVNIEYAYGTTESAGGKLVLRVSDTKRAMKALKLRR